MPKPGKTHGLFNPCGHIFAPAFGQKGICPECGHCDACAAVRTEGIDIEKVAKMAYHIEMAASPEDYACIHYENLKNSQKESWRKLARSVLVAIKEATNA